MRISKVGLMSLMVMLLLLVTCMPATAQIGPGRLQWGQTVVKSQTSTGQAGLSVNFGQYLNGPVYSYKVRVKNPGLDPNLPEATIFSIVAWDYGIYDIPLANLIGIVPGNNYQVEITPLDSLNNPVSAPVNCFFTYMPPGYSLQLFQMNVVAQPDGLTINYMPDMSNTKVSHYFMEVYDNETNQVVWQQEDISIYETSVQIPPLTPGKNYTIKLTGHDSSNSDVSWFEMQYTAIDVQLLGWIPDILTQPVIHYGYSDIPVAAVNCIADVRFNRHPTDLLNSPDFLLYEVTAVSISGEVITARLFKPNTPDSGYIQLISDNPRVFGYLNLSTNKADIGIRSIGNQEYHVVINVIDKYGSIADTVEDSYWMPSPVDGWPTELPDLVTDLGQGKIGVKYPDFPDLKLTGYRIEVSEMDGTVIESLDTTNTYAEISGLPGGRQLIVNVSPLVESIPIPRSTSTSITLPVQYASNLVSKEQILQQGETATATVDVPQQQETATFSAGIQGSDLRLVLEAPDGTVITPETVPANVTHTKTETFESYVVKNPVPGQWEMTLYPFDFPVQGEQVNLAVDVTSSVEPVPDGIKPQTTIAFEGTEGLNKWYTSDVNIQLAASDVGGSGLARTMIQIDGAGWQEYGAPVTVGEGVHEIQYYSEDKAGNIEDVGTTTVQVDKTAPVINLNSPADNAEFLVDQAVLADWGATDSVSGIQLTNGTVAAGQNIDTATPGQKTFTITASDNAGNKVVKTITYNVQYASNLVSNEQILQQGETATATVDVPEQQETATFSAGIQGSDLKLELQAPDGTLITPETAGVTHTKDETFESYVVQNPAAGKWTMTLHPFDFPPQGEQVNLAVDVTSSVPPEPDLIKPQTTIAFEGTAGLNQWYTSDVNIQLAASDAGGSGLAHTMIKIDEAGWQEYTGPVTVEEGVHQIRYYSVDNAGNTEAEITTTVKVDKTAPVIKSTVDNAEFDLNQAVLADWEATDGVSGIQLTNGTVAFGQNIDTATPGQKTFTVTACDNAGNQVVKTITYNVRYVYEGVLKPINSDGSSVFKAGSTVPVKFQLKDANGSLVSTASPKVYIAKISDNILGTEEAASSNGTADTDNTARYDSVSGQYIFNLSTKDLASGTWRISIQLEDGTSKYVDISLK